ncbi:single-stranded DNA-binding protein [Arthrobacter sp. ES1]|uniref:single-stranded DNA-binding protein n=1 Tax=Arthrobacter sp. ES1 TaxID=1897056 RepID=UPI001D0008CB|nr:single-stranded DNA-binding protein [Arthrobacter sp. ES1]MCB5281116.1 Single-stranded DNA-binding protein [Arthrobacter sp. ES1]
MSNATNNGNLIGRLAADPKAFENKDGSKKVFLTVYADRPYKKDGKTVSDQISVEAFVSNQVNGLGPYGYVHQGDLVAISTHIEQMPYTAQNGEKVFPPAKVVADGIQFLESRGTTQTRLAKRAVGAEAPAEGAAAAAAPAAEGTAYDNDMPFAEAAAG